MQIIPLNLDSVLLSLHNSKLAYCLNFKIYCDDHTSLSIEPIVLETIAYCLSRLLIGYGSYERGIVVTISRKIESCFSEIQFH